MNRPTTAVFTHAVNIATTALTQATASEIYTVPSNYMARVVYLHISHGGGNNKKMSINFYHNQDSENHLLLDDFNMTANTQHNVISNGTVFYMKSGDKLEAFMEAADGDFHVCVSLELYPDTGYY